MRDRPEEISAPRAEFDAIVNYADAIDFVQADFLEHFYQPFRQSMWAYQFGTRYLFDNEEAIELWKAFSRKANYVYFNGYDVLKTLVAAIKTINPINIYTAKINILTVITCS